MEYGIFAMFIFGVVLWLMSIWADGHMKYRPRSSFIGRVGEPGFDERTAKEYGSRQIHQFFSADMADYWKQRHSLYFLRFIQTGAIVSPIVFLTGLVMLA